jgi:hypothetical protein
MRASVFDAGKGCAGVVGLDLEAKKGRRNNLRRLSIAMSAAIFSNMSSTVMRVPRMTGLPNMTLGSVAIRFARATLHRLEPPLSYYCRHRGSARREAHATQGHGKVADGVSLRPPPGNQFPG